MPELATSSAADRAGILPPQPGTRITADASQHSDALVIAQRVVAEAEPIDDLPRSEVLGHTPSMAARHLELGDSPRYPLLTWSRLQVAR